MKTYEQLMEDAPRSRRVWVLLTLMGLVGLVSAATDVSYMFAWFIASAILLGVNSFIWLRQNPTLMQIERRRRRAAGIRSADDDASTSGD